MRHISYLFLFVAFIFNTSVFAQETEQAVEVSLPLNSVAEYNYDSGELFFNFQAEEQGVLAIAVRSVEDNKVLDIVIHLYDQYHQPIERMDEDYKRTPSREQGVLVIPGPGSYIIGIEQTQLSRKLEADIVAELEVEEVEAEELEELAEVLIALGADGRLDDATFPFPIFPDELDNIIVPEVKTIQMASAFIPTSSFVSFADPLGDRDGDDEPINASVVSPDSEEEGIVGGANDPWDWWKMECRFVQVVVSAEGRGDIILEYNSSEDNWLIEDKAPPADNEQIDILQSNGEQFIHVRVRPYYVEREVQYRIKIERCINSR